MKSWYKHFIEKHEEDIGFSYFNAQNVTDTLGVEDFHIVLRKCTLPIPQIKVYTDAGWEMAEDINDIFGDGEPKKFMSGSNYLKHKHHTPKWERLKT